MSFNWGLIADNLPLLLQGALVTVEITAMSVGCGFFIGLLVAIANLSKFTVVRLLAKCYVDNHSWYTTIGTNLLDLLCIANDYWPTY